MAKAPVFVAASLGVAKELELTTAIELWREAAEKATLAVEAERAARQLLVDRYFPNLGEGTHTAALRDHNLKYTNTINRSVVQEQFNAARAYAVEHKAEALLGLLDRAFRAKQEVVVSEWKALTAEQRKVLADIVTEKPGSPQLKYEPKAS